MNIPLIKKVQKKTSKCHEIIMTHEFHFYGFFMVFGKSYENIWQVFYAVQIHGFLMRLKILNWEYLMAHENFLNIFMAHSVFLWPMKIFHLQVCRYFHGIYSCIMAKLYHENCIKSEKSIKFILQMCTPVYLGQKIQCSTN